MCLKISHKWVRSNPGNLRPIRKQHTRRTRGHLRQTWSTATHTRISRITEMTAWEMTLWAGGVIITWRHCPLTSSPGIALFVVSFLRTVAFEACYPQGKHQTQLCRFPAWLVLTSESLGPADVSRNTPLAFTWVLTITPVSSVFKYQTKFLWVVRKCFNHFLNSWLVNQTASPDSAACPDTCSLGEESQRSERRMMTNASIIWGSNDCFLLGCHFRWFKCLRSWLIRSSYGTTFDI